MNIKCPISYNIEKQVLFKLLSVKDLSFWHGIGTDWLKFYKY